MFVTLVQSTNFGTQFIIELNNINEEIYCQGRGKKKEEKYFKKIKGKEAKNRCVTCRQLDTQASNQRHINIPGRQQPLPSDAYDA